MAFSEKAIYGLIDCHIWLSQTLVSSALDWFSAADPPLPPTMDDDFAEEEPEQKTLVDSEGKDTVEKVVTKPKKTAGGKSKKEEKPKVQNKQCLVASCNDDCVKGSKFCKPHKRSAQNMTYQAEAQSKEALKVVQDILADDSKAGIEVEKFSKMNPPDKRYMRKSVVDWVAYKQRHFKTTSTADTSEDIKNTIE